jgi:hypothetical protein
VSAMRLHVANLPAQLARCGVDAAPVELDLGLTRATRTDALTAGHPATGLAGHRLTPTTQARQEVLQLRQLDLSLALDRLGVLGEDVEDQGGPVDDLDLDDVLQGCAAGTARARSRRHRVGALGDDDVAHLLGLAASRARCRVGTLRRCTGPARTSDPAVSASAASSPASSRVLWRALGPYAREHHALERSWRYSTSVTSSSSVESPPMRCRAARSSRSNCSPSRSLDSYAAPASALARPLRRWSPAAPGRSRGSDVSTA